MLINNLATLGFLVQSVLLAASSSMLGALAVVIEKTDAGLMK